VKKYHGHDIDFDKDIQSKMKDLVIDSILSAKDYLNEDKRKNCFELLGFDFMIDEDYRVWLIEVNNNPHLGTPNAYMEDLVDEMIDDAFKLVLDTTFKQMLNKDSK
jgi:D-alanine-D-alanine ligase-like ATP-grasp enzyme